MYNVCVDRRSDEVQVKVLAIVQIARIRIEIVLLPLAGSDIKYTSQFHELFNEVE